MKYKKKVGKLVGFIPYYYNKSTRKWEKTDDKYLPDHVIGYDGDGIGSSDAMSKVEEITEEEAMELINQI